MSKKVTIQLTIELPDDVEIDVTGKAPIYTKVVEPIQQEISTNGGRITLTVEEVAELLGVGLSLIYTMVRKNQIPHKKVGARILFHKPTIEQWLLENY